MSMIINLVILFTTTIIIVVAGCLAIVYFKSYNLMLEQSKESAECVLKTFEATISNGYEKENAKGINEIFQKELDRLKKEKLDILEFNIYKLTKKSYAVSSTDKSLIKKLADPEDIEAAKK